MGEFKIDENGNKVIENADIISFDILPEPMNRSGVSTFGRLEKLIDENMGINIDIGKGTVEVIKMKEFDFSDEAADKLAEYICKEIDEEISTNK